MTPRASFPAVLLSLAALAPPDAALACAVCAGGGEESRAAFIGTTVFLSVLPLGMIGGLVWWIWRRVRAGEAARAAPTRDVATSPAASRSSSA